MIHYSDKNYLNSIPTHDDIVVENDKELFINLDDALSNHQKIPFMAINNEGSSQNINGKYC